MRQETTNLPRIVENESGEEEDTKDDLRDSSSWSSPTLLLLRDIHSKLLTQYDCKEVCAPSQSQVNVGAGVRPSSQDGVSHQ